MRPATLDLPVRVVQSAFIATLVWSIAGSVVGEFRSFDGTGNNVANPEWGSAETLEDGWALVGRENRDKALAAHRAWIESTEVPQSPLHGTAS